MGTSCSRSSKCRCVPVHQPVQPAMPIRSPASTRVADVDVAFERCAYNVEYRSSAATSTIVAVALEAAGPSRPRRRRPAPAAVRRASAGRRCRGPGAAGAVMAERRFTVPRGPLERKLPPAVRAPPRRDADERKRPQPDEPTPSRTRQGSSEDLGAPGRDRRGRSVCAVDCAVARAPPRGGPARARRT